MSQHVAQECNEQFALVHYDQAIAKSVLMIQEEETHKNNNVFICFGPFHIAMIYIACQGCTS